MSFKESNFPADSDDSGRSSRNSSSSSTTSSRLTLRSNCSDTGECMAGPGIVFRSRLRPSPGLCSPSKRRRLTDINGSEIDDSEYSERREEASRVTPDRSGDRHSDCTTSRSGCSPWPQVTAAAANVVTLRSTYCVEITGRTPNGLVIDRVTSVRNMSRTSRKTAATAGSSRSDSINYDAVDRHLLEGDDDTRSTVSGASSASSARRTAEWQRKSIYNIAAPANAAPPHTPETAIFTRSQCRKCRDDPNQLCPVHDHYNPEKRVRSPHAPANGDGGDVDDDAANDTNFDEGVGRSEEDGEDDVPVLTPTRASARSKTATTTAASLIRSNVTATPARLAPTSRSSRNQAPLAAFSDDDEEPETRKTIRRHHSVTYTNTNTRRIRPGDDPESSDYVPDGSTTTEQMKRKALLYGKKMLSWRYFKFLALVAVLSSASLTLFAFFDPRSLNHSLRVPASAEHGDFITNQILNEFILALDTKYRQLQEENADLKTLLKHVQDENRVLKDEQNRVIEQNKVHGIRLQESQSRSDEEFAQIRSSCCRSDEDIQRHVFTLLGARSSIWEEEISRLKDEMIKLKASRPSPSGSNEADFDARVWKLIWLYDADKLGLADYALESAGGTIISTRCSKTYKPKNQNVAVFGIPFFSTSRSPRTVIQPNVDPGNCWAFEGQEGYLLIKLSRRIVPTAFTYEHVQKRITPGMDISSAPQNFTVMGLHDDYSTDGDVLGKYTFLDNDQSLQTFEVQEKNVGAYEFVELRITSNQGNPEYTCLYRFRVHGQEPAY